MNKQLLGIILVIISAFCYGITPILAVYAYDGGITVITLLIIRFTAAALFFLIYCFMKRGTMKIAGLKLYPAFILGLFFSATSFFYFTSFKFISTSLAVMTYYTYPIFVAIFHFLWTKDAISKKTLISIVISFTGLVLVIGTSIGNVNLFGILLTIIAALTYSCYIVYGSGVVRNLPSILTSAIVTSTSALCFIVIGFLTREISFSFSANTWIPISGIILFSTIMAILTFFWGLDLLGSTMASLISMTEPVFSVILSSILFKQKLSIGQLIGGMIVLTGAIIGSIPRRINDKPDDVSYES